MYNNEHLFIVSGKFGKGVHEQINYFLKFYFLSICLYYSLNNFLKSCVRKAIYRKLCLIRTGIFDIKETEVKTNPFFLHMREYLRLK